MKARLWSWILLKAGTLYGAVFLISIPLELYLLGVLASAIAENVTFSTILADPLTVIQLAGQARTQVLLLVLVIVHFSPSISVILWGLVSVIYNQRKGVNRHA